MLLQLSHALGVDEDFVPMQLMILRTKLKGYGREEMQEMVRASRRVSIVGQRRGTAAVNQQQQPAGLRS